LGNGPSLYAYSSDKPLTEHIVNHWRIQSLRVPSLIP
jgi:hypothetical protein